MKIFSEWHKYAIGIAVLLGLAVSLPIDLQARSSKDDPNVTINPSVLKGLSYRSLGFSRGGRATAVAGVPSEPLRFYFGATGGGVWKTTDAGLTWRNISDGFFETGSIGAIAVADSDPNVIYVGTGSACPRGNVSSGVGVYKSMDAGKSWKHVGIREAGQIGKIRIHPKDPDLVYVAAVGHMFGPNAERGVFRSKDGGKNWEKVLFVSDKTGAVDLSMDPNNPRVLFAAMWTVERKPWTINSGSEESGLYRSTDGGDTWNKLKGGLPEGIVGKIAVAVSPADSERIWALVEAPENRGGVFRSDDGGEHWRRVNRERRFLQRAWYYIHLYADPQNPETVYVLNTGFYRSSDGGRNYQRVSTPHGDNHDLWINPRDPKKMINSNDGGANVSLNGGKSWTAQMNQATAEFYRVTVDNQFPYRVYGAQQDNSTASVSSRRSGGFRSGPSFYSVGGGESGHIAVDPRNPDIVYAGSYGGAITRMNTRTRLAADIRTYPESSTGQRAADMKYRFQWNAPIRISPHDPKVIYHTSQYVHRTKDGGHSWEIISPDLTRNDKSKQDYSGSPITHDNTGVEVYGTIFAIEESPQAPGLIWTGSDDGQVHISRNNGEKWEEITPANIPEFGVVNMIDLSAHDPGRAFIAVYRYRQDDFKPYIFRTNNFGKSWDLLTDGKNGIPENHFVRVVREDPDRKGLLYAGSEFGMYVSFDDGAHWQSLQLNLPVTPITDLKVYQKELVVATQGRAFWVLDDLTPLHQMTGDAVKAPHLFAPKQAYRAQGFSAAIHYTFNEAPKDEVVLEILDSKGKIVNTYKGKAGERAAPARSGGFPFRGGGRNVKLPVKAGMNRFDWNLSYKAPFQIPKGIVMWGGGRGGLRAVPGDYQVRLKMGDWTQTQPLKVLKDPRIETTRDQFQEQFDLAAKVGAKVKELYDNLQKIRDVRKQANEIGNRLQKAGYGKDVKKAAKALSEKLKKVEGELTQLKGEGGQDALNFPGRLDNQLVVLYGSVAGSNNRPTQGAIERFEDLKPQLSRLLEQFKRILDKDLKEFNKLVRSKGVSPVIIGS